MRRKGAVVSSSRCGGSMFLLCSGGSTRPPANKGRRASNARPPNFVQTIGCARDVVAPSPTQYSKPMNPRTPKKILLFCLPKCSIMDIHIGGAVMPLKIVKTRYDQNGGCHHCQRREVFLGRRRAGRRVAASSLTGVY